MNPAAALPHTPCCSRPCASAAIAWPSQLHARRALKGAALQRDCSAGLRQGALPSGRSFQSFGGVSPRAESGRSHPEAEASKHSEAGVSGTAADESGSHTSSPAEPRSTGHQRQDGGSPDRPRAGLRDAFSQRIPPLPARAALSARSAQHAAEAPTDSPAASPAVTPRLADAGVSAAGTISVVSTAAAPAPLAGGAHAASSEDDRGGDAGGSGSGGSFSTQVRVRSWDTLHSWVC